MQPPIDQAHPAPAAPRLSAWALAGAACSLASAATCLVTTVVAAVVDPAAAAIILLLPLLSLIGAVSGVIGLRQIGKSRGVYIGRGLALLGLFIGLPAMILQGAAVGGVVATITPVQTRIVPVITALSDAAQRNDQPATAKLMSAGTVATIGDAGCQAFFADLSSRYGPPGGVRFGLDVFMENFRRVRRATGATPPFAGTPAGAAPAAPAQGPTNVEFPKPVALTQGGAMVLLYVFTDPDALTRDSVLVMDLLAIGPDGTATTLLPDGPALAMGKWLGVR